MIRKELLKSCSFLGYSASLCAREWSIAHRVQLVAIPWTVASQAPLSTEFSRQEYWSGLPFPSPAVLPHSGIELVSPLAGGFLPESPVKPAFSKPIHDLFTPGRVKAEVKYGNPGIRKDRAWSNQASCLLFATCLSPHLGAGSRPAPLLLAFVGGQRPLPATGKVFLPPQIGSFLLLGRCWAIESLSVGLPFLPRLQLFKILNKILEYFILIKYSVPVIFHNDLQRHPKSTSKGFKGTPWDVPCNPPMGGKYTWKSVYCFIKHILGQYYIHSFSKYFGGSFYIPGFSKTDKYFCPDGAYLFGKRGWGWGAQHIINK